MLRYYKQGNFHDGSLCLALSVLFRHTSCFFFSEVVSLIAILSYENFSGFANAVWILATRRKRTPGIPPSVPPLKSTIKINLWLRFVCKVKSLFSLAQPYNAPAVRKVQKIKQFISLMSSWLNQDCWLLSTLGHHSHECIFQYVWGYCVLRELIQSWCSRLR